MFYSQQLPFACLNRFGAAFISRLQSAEHPLDRMRETNPAQRAHLLKEALAAGAKLVRPEDPQEAKDIGFVWVFPASHTSP